MGWQRRGNGYRYNSLTGHYSLIGAETKKILAAEIMSTSCAKCSKMKGDCNLPTCNKNHVGSAKSMEAAAAVKVIKSDILKEAGVKVAVLAGDEDSSTASAVRKEFADQVKRGSDLLHVQKNIKNDLYKVRCGTKSLPKKVIDYLIISIGTAVKSNKGHAEAIRESLHAIPDHAFNDHVNCGTWCRYQKDPLQYKSKYIEKPPGEVGGELHLAVKKVFEKLEKNCEKLAEAISTQPNESFNNQMASKNPKSRHYGSSMSIRYRLQAAVCQKNKSVTYMESINNELHISPGQEMRKYKLKLQHKRQKEAILKKLPEAKIKRKNNNVRRKLMSKQCEVKEGVTYKSAMGLEPVPNGEECHAVNVNCSTLIKSKKQWKNIPASTVEHCKGFEPTYIFFDTETSGRSPKNNELLQISAVTEKTDFNVYITPTKKISPLASAVNGLTFRYGKLRLNNEPVSTMTVAEALEAFLEYLAKENNVILVAHNASFDVNFLLESLIKFPDLMNKSQVTIKGFIDSLKISRRIFNKKEHPSLENHKLESLVKYIIDPHYKYQAHNALADCYALKDLFEKLKLKTDEMAYSTKFDSYVMLWKNNIVGSKLSPLMELGCTQKELQNMVYHGWTFDSLKTLCLQGNAGNTQQLLKNIVNSNDKIKRMHNFFAGRQFGLEMDH
jgi:DNA polymerase III epsilon subunit-like protein